MLDTSRLTPEVHQLVAEGKSFTEIAAILTERLTVPILPAAVEQYYRKVDITGVNRSVMLPKS